MAERDDDAGGVIQLALLPAEELGSLPAGEHERRAALAAGNRGLGRPKGALNRKSKLWQEHVLTHYASPLIGMAEVMSRPVADLAAELGCSKLEAFQLQLKAMVELAPYLHGKMPVELNVSGKGLVELNIFTGAAGTATGAALIEGELLQNQRDE